MPKTAMKVAGAVFFLVALVHLARLILKFQVMFGSHYIPLRVNAIAFVIALALGLWLFKAQKQLS